MSAIALLVFREVLEATLIISIVCAATRGVEHRSGFVAAGIALGLVGAATVAMAASRIANLAHGAGQDIFNAGVLTLAVMLIGWHVVWMSGHGRALARRMRGVGAAVRGGAQPPAILLAVVALAVVREGSEVVLFLYGMALEGPGTTALLSGAAVGLAGGVLTGTALYFGLVRIPLDKFFAVTSGLLMLLASGLAASAAGFLLQSDLLPSWGNPLWNTSRLLADDSVVGRTAGILLGYRATPAGIQVTAYLVTLALLIVGARWQQHRITNSATSHAG